MADKWKGRKKPAVSELFKLLLKCHNQLTIFVIGHLSIESVIVQLIDTKLEFPDKFDAFYLKFPQKVDLCQAYNLIDYKLANYLKVLNQYRNKYAHRLGFSLNFEEAYKLVQMAGESGIDFSDNLDTDKKLAIEVHDAEGLLVEIFRNTFFDLAFKLSEQGGDYLLV